MKNLVLGFLCLVLMGIGLVREPIKDTADLITGASTETYATKIDLIAGVSEGGYSNSYPVDWGKSYDIDHGTCFCVVYSCYPVI